MVRIQISNRNQAVFRNNIHRINERHLYYLFPKIRPTTILEANFLFPSSPFFSFLIATTPSAKTVSTCVGLLIPFCLPPAPLTQSAHTPPTHPAHLRYYAQMANCSTAGNNATTPNLATQQRPPGDIFSTELLRYVPRCNS